MGTTNWRGYAAIGLHMPKFAGNIGAVMRASHCYDAAMVAISGKRFKKESTDTMAAWRHVPVLEVENLFDVIPYGCVPVAVELLDDAAPLTTFCHPERAYYIFGAEDQTLGKNITDRCVHKVFIPTRHCMNLAATVNVVLYDRLVKRGRATRLQRIAEQAA